MFDDECTQLAFQLHVDSGISLIVAFEVGIKVAPLFEISLFFLQHDEIRPRNRYHGSIVFLGHLGLFKFAKLIENLNQYFVVS